MKRAICAALLTAACQTRGQPQPSTPLIRLAAAPASPRPEHLERIGQTIWPTLKVSVVDYPTESKVLEALERADADIAFANGADAFIAYGGDAQRRSASAIRAISLFQPIACDSSCATRFGIDSLRIDVLRNSHPFLRLLPSMPSADGRPGMPTPVLAIDTVLLCRRDLDEIVVYELTRQFLESLPSLTSKSVALDEAPATPVPLHQGAARYYREWELVR